MDADLFKRALASGGDTGTNTPAAKVPAKRNKLALSPSNDPFQDLFGDQSPGSALTSRTRNSDLGSSMEDDMQQAFSQGQQAMKSMLSGGSSFNPMAGISSFGPMAHLGMPELGSPSSGGGDEELPALIQKFAALWQQAGAQIGLPPLIAKAKAQKQLQRYYMMPPPLGRLRLERDITKLEAELSGSGSGMGGGF
ncbi:hypothetical protein LTR36_005834 [Oleoguttula mirabilis]|uniref:Uncharacterized protein n=1 Tax=Oleoguttula mirabilis TaxID=1507867 RepID=A0AAV9JE18_9PEZI|nr:hypothetical protein LTR36_005834 [Oleoguttula mirabilis]